MPRLIIALDVPDVDPARMNPRYAADMVLHLDWPPKDGPQVVSAQWSDPEPRPSRWPSETARHAALGRIPRHRWPAVEADLDLVDRLQERLAAMDLTTPGSRPFTGADVVRHLFEQARAVVIHWHTAEAHRELEATMAPRLYTEADLAPLRGQPADRAVREQVAAGRTMVDEDDDPHDEPSCRRRVAGAVPGVQVPRVGACEHCRCRCHVAPHEFVADALIVDRCRVCDGMAPFAHPVHTHAWTADTEGVPCCLYPPDHPTHARHPVGPHGFIHDGATDRCAVSTCRRLAGDEPHHDTVTVVTSGDHDDKEPPT